MTTQELITKMDDLITDYREEKVREKKSGDFYDTVNTKFEVLAHNFPNVFEHYVTPEKLQSHQPLTLQFKNKDLYLSDGEGGFIRKRIDGSKIEGFIGLNYMLVLKLIPSHHEHEQEPEHHLIVIDTLLDDFSAVLNQGIYDLFEKHREWHRKHVQIVEKQKPLEVITKRLEYV
jgi:hypothetical protein